jgi:hypothetical protein
MKKVKMVDRMRAREEIWQDMEMGMRRLDPIRAGIRALVEVQLDVRDLLIESNKRLTDLPKA